MPYLVRRRMTLDGQQYKPGDVVPQQLIDLIAPGRFGSMVRLRLLEEVTPSQAAGAIHRTRPAPAPNEDSSEGELCPICAGGPYRQLAGHMSKMHRSEQEE